MSDKKTKTKKIIISVLIIALIATAVCVFLVSKNKKSGNNSNDVIIPIGQTSTIESQINSDVINQKVCPEYNGNYSFYGIADISFTESLSRYDEQQIYNFISGTTIKDKNTFIHWLNNQKRYESTGEIISLIQGKYTKSIGQTKAESGLFFGNLNKSIVFLRDPEGTTIVDEKTYSQAFDISENGYWLSPKVQEKFAEIENKEDIEILFIREKFYYGNKIQKFFYVTYAYKMI